MSTVLRQSFAMLERKPRAWFEFAKILKKVTIKATTTMMQDDPDCIYSRYFVFVIIYFYR